MENGKFIVNAPAAPGSAGAGSAVTGFAPAKGPGALSAGGYAAPGMKVVALSTSARLCDTSVTIPGIEDGGEWPDE